MGETFPSSNLDHLFLVAGNAVVAGVFTLLLAKSRAWLAFPAVLLGALLVTELGAIAFLGVIWAGRGYNVFFNVSDLVAGLVASSLVFWAIRVARRAQPKGR